MLKSIKILSFAILLLFTSSCQRYSLRAHTEYVTYEDLASYHVGTPDPNLCNPPTGQKLMIYWKIPNSYLQDPDLHLNITVRYCNRQEVNVRFPIKKTSGSYCYLLLNQAYFSVGGIRTYNIVMEGSCGVYKRARHLLWRNLINVQECNQESEGEDSDEYEDE